MHLIFLGVVKKMINLWVKERKGNHFKLSAYQIGEISNNILKIRNTICTDFNRKPRPLNMFTDWKATEFRTYLLYIGPVVLKEYLPEANYLHFLILTCATTICLSEKYKHLLGVARRLFDFFVTKFAELYGCSSISYNIHTLKHIVDDTEEFGVLDNFSCFPYENKLQEIKRLLRGNYSPL